ncbi:hypothetical protein [Flammeovirga sp. SJP92]|uniref:hypothetical protein n=1 Tax=Flammeovirga sp. SJP92 TaxID=1775430 RepID=UPI000786C41A|nr:hypothetical protein [Flammeovirga sp. SJP92]KXX70875.1 hypothetical protein AVL50_10915 [Flammeovirga sp. SJP92]
MKSFKTLMALIAFAFATTHVQAQDGWETHTAKDGITTVKSRVQKTKDFTRIDYTVTSKGNFTLKEADEFFKNSANHKKFWENCEKSEEFKKISENDWYTYLYFNYSWPMSDVDCAQHFTRTVTSEKVVFKATTTPNAIEDRGVDRSHLFDVIITVTPIDDASSNITLEVSFGSTVSGPKWMINAWLPDGPKEIMERIIGELE